MWRWLLPLAILFLLAVATIVVWNLPAGQMLGQQSRGKASIGGDFQLINTAGQPVQASNYHGKLQLVYFGYSYCPDICPTGLLTLSQLLQTLGSDAESVNAIFITIDPQRDSAEHLKRYMTGFDPRIEALTGSQAAIDQALAAYRVYARKQGDGDHYLMDHSSYIYLMDEQGQYLQHFRHDAPVDDLTKAVTLHLSGTSKENAPHARN